MPIVLQYATPAPSSGLDLPSTPGRGNQLMTYTIAPLTEHTGAEVRGLDLSKAVDLETRGALNRAFVDPALFLPAAAATAAP